jgi:hypothetical protein
MTHTASSILLVFVISREYGRLSLERVAWRML